MEPRTPRHSLPSYHEPTPEMHRRVSREEEAELALKHTDFTAGTPAVLIALFLFTIVYVGAIQICRGPWPKLNLRSFLHAGEIKAFEKQLETDSVVSQWLLPPVQSFLTGKLRAGNEQVYPGRDGWLFYRPDVDYVTGPPFLDPAQLKRRAHALAIQPDPIKAIVQFRDQLAARGVALVLLPAPVKASIDGEKMSANVSLGAELQNASFAQFKTRLAAAGVRVFDPAPALIERKRQMKNAPAYLATDTHWRPETMTFVAEQLATSLKLEPIEKKQSLHVTQKEIVGAGDVARMLKLPPNEQLFLSEHVTIQEVTAGDTLWRPTPDADVLLLGDSFANIFSLAALGWGESAGFAEQLSHSLGGRSLDFILRNSDGAFATREILARELARGRDRLAGKKLVIWEFAARELAFGNWKLIEMKLGQAAPSHFFAPPSGEKVEISGTIAALSTVPRPGAVPYRDHIMTVQLDDVSVQTRTQKGPVQAIVYLSSMRDNVWTPAARLRVGDRITAKVRAWSEVSSSYESINRSELDDPALQLEEPLWGELCP